MTEYVSSVGGFFAVGPGPELHYYKGPVGALAGVGGETGVFQAAVLFLLEEEPGGHSALWGNTSGPDGWLIFTRPAAGVSIPNALELVVRVNGADDVAVPLVSAFTGVPILAHVFISGLGAGFGPGHSTLLFINGLRAGDATGVVTDYIPSPDAPLLGAGGPSAAPSMVGGPSRILGAMYHASGDIPGVSTGTFYTACRQAKDMVGGNYKPNPPPSFDNLYSVKRDISASAAAPDVWIPSNGAVNLTRVGSQGLDVQAHKDLDWHAALFALTVPT